MVLEAERWFELRRFRALRDSGATQSHSALIFTTSTQKRAEVTCPVCDDEYASCIGEPEYDVDVEPDGQGGYTSYIADATCTLIIARFVCGSCELRLEGPDELEAAGLNKFIDDYADPDPQDYFNLGNR